jgi:Zn-finger nucleic acid-binding protein
MHTVDRHGIHIEQCARCRGIFLDHGELEAIGNAERSFYSGPAPMHAGHGDSPRGYHGGYPDSPRPHKGHGKKHNDSPPPFHGGYGGGYGGGHGGHYRDSPPPSGGHQRHRQRSFLEQLFD